LTEQRIKFLDGLRGFLAVVVFVHHFLYVFYSDAIFGGQYYSEFVKPGMSLDKWLGLTPINLFFNPGFAIHFFFILSGYVQSHHYFSKPELNIIQKSFVKRYFRLTIPQLAVLLLIFLFHKMHWITKELVPPDPSTEGWLKSMLPDNLGFFEVVKHGLFDVYLSSFRYYQILWTMPIELMNSWMVMVLLLLSHGLKNKSRIFILWFVVQVLFMHSYYSAAFTAGAMICNFEINSEKFKKFFSADIVKFFCLVVGIYFASYPYIGYEKSTTHSFYAPISFFEKKEYPHLIAFLFGDLLLFCFVLRSEFFKKLFSKKPLQFFGDISFMFYLVHFLILMSFSPWLFHELTGQIGRHSNLFITVISTFILITGISHLLYRYVDKPALKWCSIYLKKFFGL
jgi:peptidoglycan/LPS O-acetylase OafA/YrhL